MLYKKCHICTKKFTNSKIEHVFPAAIGGGYEINGICTFCNENLGILIDEPFNNHQLIITYRFIKQIGRGKRNIKNPLKGVRMEDNGSVYTLQLNKDGYGEKKLIPEIPKAEELKIGKKFQIHIDIKDEDKIPKIIDRIQKKTGVILGTSDRKVTAGKRSQIILYDATNKLILGYAKMLYESASELVPGFVTTRMARQYAMMLKRGEIDISLSDCLVPDSKLTKIVYKDVQTEFMKNRDSHIIMLTGYNGLGLIGLIKIFNEMHIMILSKDKRFATQEMITIFNDYKKEKVEIFKVDGVPSNGKLKLKEFNGMVYSLLDEEFVNRDCKDIKIYDINGKIRYNSIFDIVNEYQFIRIIKGDFKTSISTNHLVINELFVRSMYHGKLLQIGSIELIHTFKKIK